VFADFTGDGISDLLVSSGGNEASPDSKLLSLRLYPGKPGGSFGKPRFPLPGFRETVSCLRLQKDGSRILLCIGSRAVSGAYGLLPANHLVEVKNNTWHDITMERAPVLNTIGMVSDAQFCDINKDGNSDLVLVGDWMPVTILLNKIKSFEDVTSSYNLGATTGLWRSLSCSDLDGDGKRDIVAGNYGLNNRYRPSINYPLSMYAADFGGSGQVKQVLASWKMNNYYPINSKDELSKQMLFFKPQV